MSRAIELNTLSDRHLATYRNICLMSTKAICSRADRIDNRRDLLITERLLAKRGFRVMNGMLFDKKGLA